MCACTASGILWYVNFSGGSLRSVEHPNQFYHEILVATKGTTSPASEQGTIIGLRNLSVDLVQAFIECGITLSAVTDLLVAGILITILVRKRGRGIKRWASSFTISRLSRTHIQHLAQTV